MRFLTFGILVVTLRSYLKFTMLLLHKMIKSVKWILLTVFEQGNRANHTDVVQLCLLKFITKPETRMNVILRWQRTPKLLSAKEGSRPTRTKNGKLHFTVNILGDGIRQIVNLTITWFLCQMSRASMFIDAVVLMIVRREGSRTEHQKQLIQLHTWLIVGNNSFRNVKFFFHSFSL